MSNFVLVHGGFVGGWYWADVAQRLEKAGHRVAVVEQLPSSGLDPGTLATWRPMLPSSASTWKALVSPSYSSGTPTAGW